MMVHKTSYRAYLKGMNFYLAIHTGAIQPHKISFKLDGLIMTPNYHTMLWELKTLASLLVQTHEINALLFKRKM